MQKFALPAVIITPLLVLLGCQSVELVPGKTVELHYDHVANIESGIRFKTAVPLSPPLISANEVIVKWPNEFWPSLLSVVSMFRESMTAPLNMTEPSFMSSMQEKPMGCFNNHLA